MNKDIKEENLRKCVGSVIFNQEGKVLVGKRSSTKKSAVGKWQFPQGGVNVDKNEDSYDAVLRELKEEVGLEITPDVSLKYVSRVPNALIYKYVDNKLATALMSAVKANIGQTIQYYLFFMDSKDISNVKLDNEDKPEFTQVQWMTFDELLSPANVVPFKLDIYKQLQKEAVAIIDHYLISNNTNNNTISN